MPSHHPVIQRPNAPRSMKDGSTKIIQAKDVDLGVAKEGETTYIDNIQDHMNEMTLEQNMEPINLDQTSKGRKPKQDTIKEALMDTNEQELDK